jgi:hypothetical protein
MSVYITLCMNLPNDWTMFLGSEDKRPPAAPSDLHSEVDDLPAGEARVSWTTPADDGGAGTIGFFVSVDGKEAPRYLIPVAKKPGESLLMHLRDLALQAGAEVEMSVRAVDGAGNVGPAATGDVWALRVRLGDFVSDAAPAAKRRLIELRTPPRHPENLAPGYVSVGEVP